ncbi:MAG: hypothetical protein AAGC95_04295 [Pseudomonadota bacterium]
MQQNSSIIIERRYRGPADSGNGGYSCGVLAAAINGPAEVTLKAPPPLDTQLRIEKDENGARLFHGPTEIATAEPAIVDVVPPAAPTLADAADAMTRYIKPEEHILPECFVCGPHRDEGDGLRLFTGPDGAGALAAATWTPDAEYSDDNGNVRPEIVWAALDCPGYFGLMKKGLPALLGRMSADIKHDLRSGEPYVVAGWKTGEDGRKNFAATAIYNADGEVLAVSKAIWIALKTG